MNLQKELTRDSVRRDLFSEDEGNYETPEANGHHMKNGNRSFLQKSGAGEECHFVIILIMALSLIFILLSFVNPEFFCTSPLSHFHFEQEDGDFILYFKNYRQIYILGFVCSIVVALLLGISCCAFSWMVTFFDSEEPGLMPPTPMSPSKYRHQSGHTFHSSYIMSLINGFAMFLYAIWWSKYNYFIM